jgi:hypothetical protein
LPAACLRSLHNQTGRDDLFSTMHRWPCTSGGLSRFRALPAGMVLVD